MSQIASFYLLKDGQQQELPNGNCSGEVYMAIWDYCEGKFNIEKYAFGLKLAAVIKYLKESCLTEKLAEVWEPLEVNRQYCFISSHCTSGFSPISVHIRNKKSTYLHVDAQTKIVKSGWRDSNPRPHGPKPRTLPN